MMTRITDMRGDLHAESSE